MEQPATRRIINQLRVNKPKESTDGNYEISISKPITRLHSAAVGRKALIIHNPNEPQQVLPLPSSSKCSDDIINSGSIKSLNKMSQVWDCGSTLYDSFELYSLNLQLDLAIKAAGSSSRTTLISAPHLPEPEPCTLWLCAPPPSNNNNNKLQSKVVTNQLLVPKKCSKASKSSSLNRILRSVFGLSKAEVTKNDTTTSPSQFTKVKLATRSSERIRKQGSLYVYDGSKSMRVLTTIPEVQETKLSPDAACRRPAVGRAVSERFAAHSVRVYCP